MSGLPTAIFILAPMNDKTVGKIVELIQSAETSKSPVFVFVQGCTVNPNRCLQQTGNLGVTAFNAAGSDDPNYLPELIEKFPKVKFFIFPTQTAKAEEVVRAFNTEWVEKLVPRGTGSLLTQTRLAVCPWQQRASTVVENMRFDELLAHNFGANLAPNKDPPFDHLLVYLAIVYLTTGEWPYGIVALDGKAYTQEGVVPLPQVELVTAGGNCKVVAWDPALPLDDLTGTEGAIVKLMSTYCGALFSSMCGDPPKVEVKWFRRLVFAQDPYDMDNELSAWLLFYMARATHGVTILSVTRPVPNRGTMQKVRKAVEAAAGKTPPAFALAHPAPEGVSHQQNALSLHAQGVEVAGGRQPLPSVPAVTRESYTACLGEDDLTIPSFDEYSKAHHDWLATEQEARDVAAWWAMLAVHCPSEQKVTVINCGSTKFHPLGALVHSMVRNWPREEDAEFYPLWLRELMRGVQECREVGPDGLETYTVTGSGAVMPLC